jgi:hypothetical protein
MAGGGGMHVHPVHPPRYATASMIPNESWPHAAHCLSPWWGGGGGAARSSVLVRLSTATPHPKEVIK